jgi:hypothetical protein
MKQVVAALYLAFLVSVTGCSLFFGPNSQRPSVTEQGRTAPSTPVVEKKSTGIEITWEVPSEPVDGFVVRYGESRTNLSKEMTILRSELREERDPQYGPVYRYIIRDIDGKTPIFVSVAAFIGTTLSDFSDAVSESRVGL